MTNLMKFNAADLDQLMDKITRNSIGSIDDYLNNVFHTQTQSNFSPHIMLYNQTTLRLNLRITLSRFTKDEIKVYTEYGKLTVKGGRKKQPPKRDNTFIKDLLIGTLKDHGHLLRERKLLM